MTDIFLYQGEASPDDVKLRDPTMSGAAGSTINADLAAVEAQDVAAFAAVLVHVATFTVSEAQDTAAFAGVRLSVGTLAATDAQDVAAFSGVLVHVADLAATEQQDIAAITADVIGTIDADVAATEAPDVAAFDATVISSAAVADGQQQAPAGRAARDVRRRRYIMPDGAMVYATTSEAFDMLRDFSAPAVTEPAPSVLQKRDVRFLPAEDAMPDTWKAVIPERFTYQPPPETRRQAEILANRMRADDEAILALIL